MTQKESYLLDNLAKVGRGPTELRLPTSTATPSSSGWIITGTSRQLDPQRFPDGFTQNFPPLLKETRHRCPACGLIAPSNMWSVGGNPAVRPDPHKQCRVRRIQIRRHRVGRACAGLAEPIKSMYSRAFRYHIRENGVRLIEV